MITVKGFEHLDPFTIEKELAEIFYRQSKDFSKEDLIQFLMTPTYRETEFKTW